MKGTINSNRADAALIWRFMKEGRELAAAAMMTALEKTDHDLPFDDHERRNNRAGP